MASGHISTAKKILKTGYRKDLERLGKLITNSDDKIWNLVSKEVVMKANLAKVNIYSMESPKRT